MKYEINLALVGATVRGSDLRDDSPFEDFCVINDSVAGDGPEALCDYVISQYALRGFKVEAVSLDTPVITKLNLQELYKRLREEGPTSTPSGALGQLPQGGAEKEKSSRKVTQRPPELVRNGKDGNPRPYTANWTSTGGVHPAIAAKAEKQEIAKRLDLYQAKHGLGWHHSIAAASGLSEINIRQLANRESYPIEIWRKIKTALDVLEAADQAEQAKKPEDSAQ